MALETITFAHSRYFQLAYFKPTISSCNFTYFNLTRLFENLKIKYEAGPFFKQPAKEGETSTFWQFTSKYFNQISVKPLLQQSQQEIANTFRNLNYTQILARLYPDQVLAAPEDEKLYDETDFIDGCSQAQTQTDHDFAPSQEIDFEA